MITWVHIPAHCDKMLPEQWQARVTNLEAWVGGYSVAAVLRDNEAGEWQAIMLWPDGDVASLRSNALRVEDAQRDVEETLKDTGWK